MFLFFFKFIIFIYFWLRWVFAAVQGLLTAVASPVAEHGLQERRLSSCGVRAQLLCGTEDPPGPGLEPVSPALAGGLSTTVPPGKPFLNVFNVLMWLLFRASSYFYGYDILLEHLGVISLCVFLL